MTKRTVSFQALGCLQNIVAGLNYEEKPTTATTLKRYYNCESPHFDEAVSFGVSEGIIRRESWNVITLLNEDWVIDEANYYETCMEAVRKLWLKSYDSSEIYLENTSSKNSKIAGPWTRPDFTLVSHKKFHWTVGHEFDVNTFEVKRPKTCNVLAIFEALSHASAATRAYAVFPISEKEWTESDPAQAQRVIEECARHGVGLILIEDIHRKPKAVHRQHAAKRPIDHEKCSSFLGAVLSQEGKECIAKWK